MVSLLVVKFWKFWLRLDIVLVHSPFAKFAPEPEITYR